MLRPALATLLTAGLVLAAPAPAAAPVEPASASAKAKCTRGGCAARRARRLLGGRMYTRFVDTGSVLVPSSFDQRLHLCRSGRFVYDTVSDLPEVGTTVSRVEGGWKVASARFFPRLKRARARVRAVPDDGSAPLTVTITTDGSATRIDGLLVAVSRSDLC